MTDTSGGGPDYTAALAAIASTITAATTSNVALAAAVTAHGNAGNAKLDLVIAELKAIRRCLCDTSGAPETVAMRELALRFPDLPPAEKWARFGDLVAAEVAAREAAANA